MTGPLRVPPPLVPRFQRLNAFSDEQFEALTAAIGQCVVSDGLSPLAEAASDAVPDLSAEEADLLIQALVSLFQVVRTRDADPTDTISAFAASEDLELGVDDRPRFEHRIATALALKPLRLLSKTLALSSDHERVFLAGRVLTDIRPIFSDDEEASAEGALVSQVLRIEYLNNAGQEETISVVLDEADIRSLKVALARAEAKGRSTRDLLMKAEINYVGVVGVGEK